MRECCLLLYFDSINQVQTSISQLNVFISIMFCFVFLSKRKKSMSLIFKHKKVLCFIIIKQILLDGGKNARCK